MDLNNLAQEMDICRVCLSEGTPDHPLFNPCICSGTIKYVHQHCLVEWIRYSTKECCELCKYRFLFTPIYAPNMPKRLPIKYVVAGLTYNLLDSIKYCVHIVLVIYAWTLILPFTAGRMYRILFSDSLDIDYFPIDVESISRDILNGFFIVPCSLCILTGFIWIRFQILHGIRPDWLERDEHDMNRQFDILLPLNPERNFNEDDNGEFDEEGLEFDEGVFDDNDQELDEDDQEFDEDDGEFIEINVGNANRIVPWWEIGWGERGIVGGMTMNQLFGFDGSMYFLKFIPLLIWINALVLLFFIFFPYKIGNFIITKMALQDKVASSYILNIVTILCGYCLIGLNLLIIHYFANITGFRKMKRAVGLIYIFVKILLILVLRIGILPLMCGWWLDLCSWSMFDSSFENTLSIFHLAPGTLMFIRWVVGIVYVYYLGLFILCLQDVVRPGVLWFIPDINNPEYNHLQELIQRSTLLQGRRLIILFTLFCIIAFLIEWLPIKILKFMWPSFFQYNETLRTDFDNKFSMEPTLLQILLPVILGKLYACHYFKIGIHVWCIVVSCFLGIESYLLGEEEYIIYIQRLAADFGIGNEELVRQIRLARVQSYTRPTNFAIRLITLLILATISVVIISSIVIIIQIWLGRLAMPLISALFDFPSESQLPNFHEFFSTLLEIYICWWCLRIARLRAGWLPERPVVATNCLKFWIQIGFKVVVACIVLLGILPYLFGLLSKLIMVIPSEVPFHQTPLTGVQDIWTSGTLYMKLIGVVTILGPDWYLRRTIDHIFRDGIIHLDLEFIFKNLVVPMFIILSLSLAIPYVIAYSIVPLIVKSETLRLLIARRIYPTLLLMAVIIYGIIMLVRKYKRLCIQIKNDKYLIGRRLVNYNRRT